MNPLVHKLHAMHSAVEAFAAIAPNSASHQQEDPNVIHVPPGDVARLLLGGMAMGVGIGFVLACFVIG